MDPLCELVDYVVRSFVDRPDAVEVRGGGSDSATITLKVDPTDMGKVIGKEGRTAKALRALLQAASSQSGRRVILELVDESRRGPREGRRHGPRSR